VNPGEHALMARVEQDHWWYRGLRDVVARCLGQPELSPGSSPRVLDAGCGTGANLAFLTELLAPSYLGGFDSSDEAVALARAKAARADLYRSDVCEPEIHGGELDLVISLDVIYIPGAERAMPGLRALVRALRSGGLFVLHLPAYAWLYGEHDLAVHTRERYTVPRVGRLLEALGLMPERLTYRLCLPFPAVVLARLPGILRARRGAGVARSDLRSQPGTAVSATLYRVLTWENAVIARGGRWPFGSSVFAIGRKP